MKADPYFKVKVLDKTSTPQSLVWQAMHQDYSEKYIFDEKPLPHSEAGDMVVKHLLKGGRGHYGPLEHPSITFAVGFFPHSVIQQARTHRIGTSWDVQSMRYTGKRVANYATDGGDIESIFYLRPVGEYSNRQGKKYDYTDHMRKCDLIACMNAARRYAEAMEQGVSEEHARGVLPFDYRQHFVVTFNMRSLMHFLDLRAKADAQAEIGQMCQLMLPHFEDWAPEVCEWYVKNRWGKARLAP
tara:strand:- start:3131 stop:3856 length:726 start_codon:yes stop_codon:yes gene_type:complete